MADINLETVVDYILKSGKVVNEGAFQTSMNQILGALIQKLDAPTALLDVPVHLQTPQLSTAEVSKFKKELQTQIDKLKSDTAEALAGIGPENSAAANHKARGVAAANATVQAFFEGIQSGMNKIPPVKVSKQTRSDLEKVLADPFHIDEILKSKNGQQRVQNLRAYTQYVDDMRQEIASIHKKASAGTKLPVGSGESFEILNTLKMSLPDFGSLSQQLTRQLNEVRKLTDQVNLVKQSRQKLIRNISAKAERDELKRQYASIDGNLKNATPEIFDFRGVDDIFRGQANKLRAQINAERGKGNPTTELSNQLKQIRAEQSAVRKRRGEAEGNSLALGFDKHLENAQFSFSKAESLIPQGKTIADLSPRKQTDVRRYLSSALTSAERAQRLAGNETHETSVSGLLTSVNKLRDRINKEKAISKAWDLALAEEAKREARKLKGIKKISISMGCRPC